jgi:hypothetical protein
MNNRVQMLFWSNPRYVVLRSDGGLLLFLFVWFLIVLLNLPFAIFFIIGFTLCIWLSLHLKRKTSSKFYGIAAFCVSFTLFCGLGFYYARLYSPFPSDEKMIANFKANQADFIELVRRYHEYPHSPDTSSSLWDEEGDTQEIFKRTGIGRIVIRDELWLPEPYSAETAKRKDELLEKRRSLISYLRTAREAGQAPEFNAQDTQAYQQYYKYRVLEIQQAPEKRLYPFIGTQWCLLGSNIRKDYYFFPEAPRIENDELLGPMKADGEYSYSYRVLPSLNRFPIPWKPYECVYRQIEPQWFIRMCKGR